MCSINAFSLLLFVLVHVTSCCQDLDYHACVHAHTLKPTFCEDDALATSVCPKYCNKCPIACYSCNSTLEDYHQCKVVKICQAGERCMRRELNSIIDGHHEYELTCAKKSFCDDPWQGISMFGKRDISISCCAENLCNYPGYSPTPAQPTTTTSTTTTTQSTTTRTTTTPTPTTTTTKPTTHKPSTSHSCSGCCKDLMIAVDESGSMNEQLVKEFLINIISELTIGPSDTLVSLGLFLTSGRVIFDIGDHVNKSETIEAIKNIDFRAGHAEVNAGIHYLMRHATSAAGGDRPEYPNTMLIITDDGTSHVMISLENNLHHRGDVIAVELQPAYYHHLGSNSNAVFHLQSESQLTNIDHRIATLICQGVSGHSTFTSEPHNQGLHLIG
ncbi:DOMON domain-containing protein frrs1L [Mactra antiquata]